MDYDNHFSITLYLMLVYYLHRPESEGCCLVTKFQLSHGPGLALAPSESESGVRRRTLTTDSRPAHHTPGLSTLVKTVGFYKAFSSR